MCSLRFMTQPPKAEQTPPHSSLPGFGIRFNHLDLVFHNFGIQDGREFTKAERDVFPCCPELKDGYFCANDKPVLDLDADEKLAANFPVNDDPAFDLRWGNLRRRDGTVTNPREAGKGRKSRRSS